MGYTNRADTLKADPVTPTAQDLALIATLYADDFSRFGYVPDDKAPLVPAPELSPEFLAQNAAARVRASRPLHQMATRIRRKVRKWQG